MIVFENSEGKCFQFVEGSTDCINCAFLNDTTSCIESNKEKDCSDPNGVWTPIVPVEASKTPSEAVSEGTQGVGSQKASEEPVGAFNAFTVNDRGGIKEEKGKVRPTLLFKDCNSALSEVMDVLEMGAKKYQPSNWRKVEVSQYEEALLRHIMKYFSGETVDPESGKHHLAHAVCDALFIQELTK